MITDSLEKFETNLLLLFELTVIICNDILCQASNWNSIFFIEDGVKQDLIKIYFVEPRCRFSTYLEWIFLKIQKYFADNLDMIMIDS